MITNITKCGCLLKSIDHFIFSILDGSLNDTEIKQFLMDITPKVVSLKNNEWEYCPSITIFFDLTAELLKHYRQHSSLDQLSSMAYINCFKRQVLLAADIFHADILKFQRAKQVNEQKLIRYMCNLFVHYHRLLLVRIDLGLKSEIRYHQTMKDLSKYLKILCNRFANKDGIFRYLHGYVWTIEERQEKGPHAHLLLFFSGDKHQNDYGLACKIRDYWKELTAGNGTLFSCNAKDYKAKMESLGILGIGMISRDDSEKVYRAINAAIYLTLADKYLQRIKVIPPFLIELMSRKTEAFIIV